MANLPVPTFTRRAITATLAASLLPAGSRGHAQAQAGSERSDPDAPVVTWRAGPLRKALRPDRSAEAELWAFNGEVAGPILRVRPGDEVRLLIVNDTPKPLSMHWLGVRGPNRSDGAGGLTQEPIAPGARFEYRFRPPDSGTFLVRPCVIGGSAEPTERGLTGLLIVEETSPPPVDHDVALLVDDWLLTESGGLAPFPTPGPAGATGRLGNWISVNGKAAPERVEASPGSRIRLRLANGSNARSMRLLFEGIHPYVIAVDGQPTDTFEPLKASLPFAPGSRYDLLLDMPSDAGAAGSVIGQVGAGVALLSLTATGASASPRAPIAPLAPNPNLPPAIRLERAIRKEVTISGEERPGGPPWLLNGKAGSVGMPALISVKRGSPVVLTVNNRSPIPQPLHLHGHVFRLLHPYDDGWDPYFLDIVQVPEGRTSRLAFVADNPGKWLLASSVLERFDAGLWTWLEVT